MKRIIIAIIAITLTILLIVVLKQYIPSSSNNIKQIDNSLEKEKLIFSFIDIDNITHNQETIKDKYLIVNYWATWCEPCIKEIPILIDFYNKNMDKVEILGLNNDNVDIHLVYEFKDTFNINYPIILNNNVNSKYYSYFVDLLGLPTTVIYSQKGDLLHTFIGVIDIQDLEKFIL